MRRAGGTTDKNGVNWLSHSEKEDRDKIHEGRTKEEERDEGREKRRSLKGNGRWGQKEGHEKEVCLPKVDIRYTSTGYVVDIDGHITCQHHATGNVEAVVLQ